ncbi:MAG: lysylphosphatidylglycerol synthase domain-containing protein, partial [Gemmatimonadota bacterium]|nr:lysylphosphatidylglycerol synthase domain-containing protein [Gemmatimonadota bacterium]
MADRRAASEDSHGGGPGRRGPIRAVAETAAPDPASRRRRAAFQIGGSVVVLGLLIAFLPREELFEAFGRLPLAFLLLAIPGYLVLHLGGAFKWRLLVNAASGGLTGLSAVRCYYSGLFGSTFLPSIVGGDFVRAGLALRLAKSKAGVVLGSVLDRTLDVIALATVAGVGALLVPAALPPESRRIWLGL